MVEQSTAPNRQAASELRVMVVDDDPVISRLLISRLAARGYRVEAAGDGEEALALVDAFRPDVVFLDIVLPGISGLDVLQQLREQALDLAIVMTTAFGSEEVAIDALRHGADDYLRKPFEPGEFQAVLERTVSRLQLHRHNLALQNELADKHRQLEIELARAAEVQTELLPQAAPVIPGFDLAARCLPARTVGGDFYDWSEPASGVMALTLGDAMGKGMPAALMMATIRAALRSVAGNHPPALSLDLVGSALGADLARAASFMTLFHARLSIDTRSLTYVDAGHGFGFVRRGNGEVEELRSGGLPLGLFVDQKYQSTRVTLAPGDALVVYSDGLISACRDRTLTNEMLADRLIRARTAQEMVERLMALPDPGTPMDDDLTVLVLYCRGRE